MRDPFVPSKRPLTPEGTRLAPSPAVIQTTPRNGKKFQTMTEQISSYREAGVDIDQSNLAKKKIRSLAKQTFTRGVLTEIGGFGGLFSLSRQHKGQTVLVSSVDGVGTKLKVAFATGVHDTVGRDLVAHCVNDILVQGATPLFFMDYIATGKLSPRVVAEVVKGIATGCKESGCALLGGETAEMPGFYQEGEYDLAGFIVGVVEKRKIIDGKAIRPGHVLLGLPSAGLHTNGYSLARKLLLDSATHEITNFLPELNATTGEALLAPHLNYLGVLGPLIAKGLIKGLAHVTGGGLTENIPRILPPRCNARIQLGSWPVLPIFQLLQRLGNIPEKEMLRTFNMGIGMVLVVSPRDLTGIQRYFKSRRETMYHLGEIGTGTNKVVYLS
jgi:phosphoribosylformylglycinamidine cyclo-ligase